MREIRSYGSVGERDGNEPLYPEIQAVKILVAVAESLLPFINGPSHL